MFFMIQKNYFCVYGVFCMCIVQASFPMHAQVEAEAEFLSELEAHSFGLASWQMRLQDSSLPIPDPGAGVYRPVQPCVDFYMCSRVLNSVLMLAKKALLATELSSQPQCTLLFEIGFILNPKITFLARLVGQQTSGTHFIPTPRAGVIDARCYTWFYLGDRDLNSGLHACTVNTLPTEPYPQQQLLSFHVNYIEVSSR